MPRPEVTWHRVSSITYGTETVPIPIIPVGRNGWVYKPQMLLSNSRDKIGFGRGRDGVAKAEQWLKQYVGGVLANHDWQLPDSVTRQNAYISAAELQHTYEAGLVFGYPTPYGDMQLQLLDSSRHEMPGIRLSIPAMVRDIIGKQVIIDNYLGSIHSFNIEDPALMRNNRQTYQPVASLIQRFYKDPHGTMLALLKSKTVKAGSRDFQNILEQIPPPESWERVNFMSRSEPIHKAGLFVEDYFKRYLPGTRERALVPTDYKMLEQVLRLFTDLGLRIRVTEEESVSGNVEITSINVRTPRLDAGFDDLSPWERGGLEEHEFTIKSDGVAVKCGYLTHEEHWVKYQARQMEQIFGWEDEEESPPEDPPETTEVLDY